MEALQQRQAHTILSQEPEPSPGQEQPQVNRETRTQPGQAQRDLGAHRLLTRDIQWPAQIWRSTTRLDAQLGADG